MYSTLYADDDNDHNHDDDDDDSRKQKLCRVPSTPPSLPSLSFSLTLSHSFAFGLTFSPSLSILDFCEFAFCAVVSVIVIEYV